VGGGGGGGLWREICLLVRGTREVLVGLVMFGGSYL